MPIFTLFSVNFLVSFWENDEFCWARIRDGHPVLRFNRKIQTSGLTGKFPVSPGSGLTGAPGAHFWQEFLENFGRFF